MQPLAQWEEALLAATPRRFKGRRKRRGYFCGLRQFAVDRFEGHVFEPTGGKAEVG